MKATVLAASCPGAWPRRRAIQGLLSVGVLAGPAWAQDGVRGDVGGNSRWSKFYPADKLENDAAQSYAQTLGQARQQRALAPPDHPQLVRLRAIAQRIIPFTPQWNERARQWKWEVNLLGSKELNAYCMPGGKIAFYYGILQKLQLSDDEVATIMGHEVAHALREHARERMAKTMATRGAVELGSLLFGLGQVGRSVAGFTGEFVLLKFSREDETEADIVGMDLAARAGYNPSAGVTLWQKMMKVSQGAPPQFLSTHPAGDTRIKDIEAKLPKVLPLYEAAAKPERRYGPPQG